MMPNDVKPVNKIRVGCNSKFSFLQLLLVLFAVVLRDARKVLIQLLPTEVEMQYGLQQ